MKNGESVTATVEYPKGDAKNPFTLEELRDKFRALTDNILSLDQQERLIRISGELERHRVREVWTFNCSGGL